MRIDTPEISCCNNDTVKERTTRVIKEGVIIMIVDMPPDEGGNSYKLGTFMIDNCIYTLYINDSLSIKVCNESGNSVLDSRIIKKIWKMYLSYLF